MVGIEPCRHQNERTDEDNDSDTREPIRQFGFEKELRDKQEQIHVHTLSHTVHHKD